MEEKREEWKKYMRVKKYRRRNIEGKAKSEE